MKLFRRTSHVGMSSNWRLCSCSYLCAQKSNPYTVVKSFTRLAKIAENVKFVDDLQQALRESLAVFPDSELKSEQKLTIENIVGRRDVFGQLPTGFGKSVIFSAAAMTKAYRFFLSLSPPSYNYVSMMFQFYSDKCRKLHAEDHRLVELFDWKL